MKLIILKLFGRFWYKAYRIFKTFSGMNLDAFTVLSV
jgi:hypothetical protein